MKADTGRAVVTLCRSADLDRALRIFNATADRRRHRAVMLTDGGFPVVVSIRP